MGLISFFKHLKNIAQSRPQVPESVSDNALLKIILNRRSIRSFSRKDIPDDVFKAILEAGNKLINLHIADSNRCALGDGSIDLDIIIMALYLIEYNTDGKYVTPEPLGPGADPYPAMNSIPDQEKLNELVVKTVNYFRERENELVT